MLWIYLFVKQKVSIKTNYLRKKYQNKFLCKTLFLSLSILLAFKIFLLDQSFYMGIWFEKSHKNSFFYFSIKWVLHLEPYILYILVHGGICGLHKKSKFKWLIVCLNLCLWSFCLTIYFVSIMLETTRNSCSFCY